MHVLVVVLEVVALVLVLPFLVLVLGGLVLALVHLLVLRVPVFFLSFLVRGRFVLRAPVLMDGRCVRRWPRCLDLRVLVRLIPHRWKLFEMGRWCVLAH